MNYFSANGRRVPEEGMRVFADKPSFYYTLPQPEIDYKQIYDRSRKFGILTRDIGAGAFQEKANSIIGNLRADVRYSNLLNGVHVPFIIDMFSSGEDLGVNLEDELLPCVQKSFNDKFPEAHFKAVLQSDSKLPNNVTLAEGSNYELLIKKIASEPVIGWYFPQALQEFDIQSQRSQMNGLVDSANKQLCLSGGLDICAALVGTPELLISDETYAPILCMSAYVHKDPRLVLLIKSYGPHMEFWCMTQMLAKGVTQVSEQWAGGITAFM